MRQYIMLVAFLVALFLAVAAVAMLRGGHEDGGHGESAAVSGVAAVAMLRGGREYSQEQKDRLEHCSNSLVTGNIEKDIKSLLNDPDSFQWVEAERFRRSLSSTSIDLLGATISLNIVSANFLNPNLQWKEGVGLVGRYADGNSTRTIVLSSEDNSFTRLEGFGYPSTSLAIYQNTAVTGVNLWVAEFRAKNAYGAYVVGGAGGYILSESCDVIESSIIGE